MIIRFRQIEKIWVSVVLYLSPLMAEVTVFGIGLPSVLSLSGTTIEVLLSGYHTSIFQNPRI